MRGIKDLARKSAIIGLDLQVSSEICKQFEACRKVKEQKLSLCTRNVRSAKVGGIRRSDMSRNIAIT